MIEISTHSGVTCVRGTRDVDGIGMSVYVFLTDHLLIDTGPSSLLGELSPFYQSQQFDLAVLTHAHEDHTGCAAWIEENKHVPLYIHSMSIDECSRPGSYPKYREEFWGRRDPFAARGLGDTITGRHDMWKAIPTPGHAAEHVVFLSTQSGMLFSGDLFVTPKTKIIMRQESIPTLISSIRTVLTCDFGEMFCCHAGYIPDGKHLMSMKLEYLESVSGQILDLHRRGYSISEIDQTIFPRTHALVSLSNHEWDSKHIVESVITAQYENGA